MHQYAAESACTSIAVALGYAQNYRQTVWEIHVVKPEEEKEDYIWKDLRKRKVLSYYEITILLE